MAEEQKVIGIPKVTKETKIETEDYEQIFTLVTEDDGANKRTRIAIGNSIVWREDFKTINEAKAFINAKPWGLIVNTVLFIQEKTNN